MGLLLRTVRPAPDEIREVASQLRPHRPRLLPGQLSRPGSGPAHSGAAALLVYGDGFCAGDISQGNSVAAAGETTQPLSADPASLSPADQSVDPGSCVARGESQPADRSGVVEGRSKKYWVAPIEGRSQSQSGRCVDAVEPRD